MRALVLIHNGQSIDIDVSSIDASEITSEQIGNGQQSILIKHDINVCIASVLSQLSLFGYDTKLIIVQYNSPQWQNAYIALNSQIKQFNLKSVVLDDRQIASKKFVDTILSKLFSIKSMIHKNIQSETIDVNDHSSHSHGRMKHAGSLIGNYVQTPPLLFTRDGHSVWFGDMYRGRSAFLILGGPSFNSIDKNLLSKPGVLTMGVNNSVKSFRPNMWVSVDTPGNFMKSIWYDSKIMKFVPYSHVNKLIFDNEKWVETDVKVGDCPNVWYYRRNEKFNANNFLFEDTFNWGNHKQHGGGRSVMLVAMRMLFYLGIRNVYLLGCDFNMDDNNKYHFEQDRSESSIKGNSNTYRLLIDRFEQLKPIFDKYDYNIYNCNQNSNLKVFPMISFDQAIKYATYDMPDTVTERSAGLYDRVAKLREKQKKVENGSK